MKKTFLFSAIICLSTLSAQAQTFPNIYSDEFFFNPIVRDFELRTRAQGMGNLQFAITDTLGDVYINPAKMDNRARSFIAINPNLIKHRLRAESEVRSTRAPGTVNYVTSLDDNYSSVPISYNTNTRTAYFGGYLSLKRLNEKAEFGQSDQFGEVNFGNEFDGNIINSTIYFGTRIYTKTTIAASIGYYNAEITENLFGALGESTFEEEFQTVDLKAGLNTKLSDKHEFSFLLLYQFINTGFDGTGDTFLPQIEYKYSLSESTNITARTTYQSTKIEDEDFSFLITDYAGFQFGLGISHVNRNSLFGMEFEITSVENMRNPNSDLSKFTNESLYLDLRNGVEFYLSKKLSIRSGMDLRYARLETFDRFFDNQNDNNILEPESETLRATFTSGIDYRLNNFQISTTINAGAQSGFNTEPFNQIILLQNQLLLQMNLTYFFN